ncbi:MAG: substrate-binding domain-containing protein [Coriobacteriales bacterium]
MLLENENALKAEDVAKILKIGRNAVYSMAKSGELRSYRIGRKLRFTYKDIQDYIDGSRTGMSPASNPSRPLPQPGEFVLSGQDALVDVLAEHTRRRGVFVSVCGLNSYDALCALYKEEASAACCSLYDADSESYNRSSIKRMLPGVNAVMIHLATMSRGLLVASGNPKNISGIEDLSRPGVRIANREKGSSARVFLDSKLQKLGISPSLLSGYEESSATEMGMAAKIAQGYADAGIGRQQTASRVEGLEFIPLCPEDYCIVLREETLKTPQAKVLLEVISSGELQDAFSCASGYDTSATGRYAIIR